VNILSIHQVLIADSEWNMRKSLRFYLEKQGFYVKEATTGTEALEMLKKYSFDIILLDIILPDMDGWQVCKVVKETVFVPMLILTEQGDTKDKIRGLRIGADDYLTKNIEPEELLARIYSILRRVAITKSMFEKERSLEFPGLIIYPKKREIYIDGILEGFSQKDFDLIVTLAQRREKTFTREELVDSVWGYDFEGENRVVDTHIKKIRQKFQNAGLKYSPIQTVRSIGYRFFKQD